MEQERGGNMQGVHRADARFRGLFTGVAQNQLQIFTKYRSPKITLVETMLVLLPIEAAFGKTSWQTKGLLR